MMTSKLPSLLLNQERGYYATSTTPTDLLLLVLLCCNRVRLCLGLRRQMSLLSSWTQKLWGAIAATLIMIIAACPAHCYVLGCCHFLGCCLLCCRHLCCWIRPLLLLSIRPATAAATAFVPAAFILECCFFAVTIARAAIFHCCCRPPEWSSSFPPNLLTAWRVAG